MNNPSPSPALGSDFLWGVATSPYQHEGGFNQPGLPLNNWAWAEQEGRVEVSGNAADFWQRAPQDFALCRALGLNSFRLGLSWSRLQPVKEFVRPLRPLTPPPFDFAALDHYTRMIADCRAAGLEPILTLQHFTHPLWLGIDAWLHEKTINYFLVYVETVVSHLVKALPRDHGCAPPRYYLTINEPNILASCTYFSGNFPSGGEQGLHQYTICLGHLLEAHVRARRLIHRIYEGQPVKPLVAFNNYCSDLYWNDQAWLDLMFTRARGVPRQHVFSHLWQRAWQFDDEFEEADLPIRPWMRRVCGQALKKMQHFLVYTCSFDSAWTRLVDLIYESPEPPLDYLAIDYYDPFAAHALRLPTWNDRFGLKRNIQEHLLDGITSKWWDWKELPEGLSFFVRSLERFNLPILIAENGMAHRCQSNEACFIRKDKLHRSAFIRRNVQLVTRLKQEGLPLIGYLYWSLVDNYEWGTYSARFGLYSLKFLESLDRHEFAFSGDNAAEAYSKAIAEARVTMAGESD